MTNEEKMREAFEAWMNSDIPQFNGELKYKDVEVSPYMAWQASRVDADAEFAKEREQLLGKMAMMQDALRKIGSDDECEDMWDMANTANQAFSATQPEVEASLRERDTRICAEKDAEIARLKESEQCWITNAKNLQVGYNELDKKHREANARIAMMKAELEHVKEVSLRECGVSFVDEKALSATYEQVAALEREKEAKVLEKFGEKYSCVYRERVDGRVFYVGPSIKELADKDAAELRSQSAQLSEARCKSCNGNDGDIPCAYPSEGKHGCLRDARLSTQEDKEK